MRSIPVYALLGSWISLITGCQPDYAVQAIDGDVAIGDTDPAVASIPDPPREDPPVIDEEDPAPENDCLNTSDLIYVISRGDEKLYLFDPITLDFDIVGQLDCGIYGEPGSMGVARDGYAYVRYSDQTIYEVDLVTLECSEMQYQDPGFGAFGMGYATDSAHSWRDQLYVANFNSLAKLDTGNWNLNKVGDLPSQSELTGNADGELFAFLPLQTPAAIVQLDKDSGQVINNIPLNNFPNPFDIDAFAFATWGGEFWLFVREYGMGSSSDVYRVRGNQIRLERANIGFDIVGAGVATCAPGATE